MSDAPTSSPKHSLLKIEDLRTYFFTEEGKIPAVDGVNLHVSPGKVLAVVGESGCGKSVTSFSILRLIQSPGKIMGGRILFQPDSGAPAEDILALDEKSDRLFDLRGGDISMIFQEPMSALSPVHTVGNQICEAILNHQEITEEDARQKAIDMLGKVGIPNPGRCIDQYPHELSGGMRQRVVIAMALVCDPKLLIADEPTTALDVTIQAQILKLIKDMQQASQTAVVFITHDLGVVAQIADEVAVMYLGQVVEQGTVRQVLKDPLHPYTAALLRSLPALKSRGARLPAIKGSVPSLNAIPAGCPFHPRCPHAVAGVCDHGGRPDLEEKGEGRRVACVRADEIRDELLQKEEPVSEEAADAPVTSPQQTEDRSGEPPLLQVRNLCKYFPIRSKGLLKKKTRWVKAVDDVSFDLHKGETFGIVGESGSGKTTCARTILRALQPTSGDVLFDTGDGPVNLATLSGSELKPLRQKMQMIFQDPFSSLNPRMTVQDIIAEPMRIHRLASGSELEDRVVWMLNKVGLKPEHRQRYPHAFSGGQRQRIGIARALMMNPDLIVADESVSALDVSVQAQVINLLQDLQDEFGLTYIFVAHDLSVVRHICDRVAVMYAGKIVELAETDALFEDPKHPYTKTLLSAVPLPDPDVPMNFDTSGEVADPGNLPGGCSFHPRCPERFGPCDSQVPALLPVGEGTGRCTACHLYRPPSSGSESRE